MKRLRDELISDLTKRFNSMMFDTKKIQKYGSIAYEKFNTDLNLVIDCVFGKKNLNELLEEELFALTKSFDICNGTELVNRYFNAEERNKLETYKYNRYEENIFPIKFCALKMSDIEFICKTDLRQLYDLYKNNLLGDNFHRRFMGIPNPEGSLFSASDNISREGEDLIDQMNKYNFSKTILLNIPDAYSKEKSEFVYENGIVSFDSIPYFDVIDHLYLQCAFNNLKENDSFNQDIVLKLLKVDYEEMIGQILTNNVVGYYKKDVINALNSKYSVASDIVDELNTLKSSPLYQRISKKGIDYSLLSSIVEMLYKPTKENKEEILNDIIIKAGIYFSSHQEYLKKITPFDTKVIFYVFYKNYGRFNLDLLDNIQTMLTKMSSYKQVFDLRYVLTNENLKTLNKMYEEVGS